MIERARELGTRTGEMQFRKNLLLARFHVEDALEETVEVGRDLLSQPLNPRQRDHVESHFVLACADLGLDEEIDRVLASAYGFSTVDLTARATILWAKAESDWLAGRAAEALQTAEECRALPVTGFPTHIMVEPVRQWAALDLGLDPGEPLTDVLFPNFVAANKESRAIVAMYRDPENSRNAGTFLAAAKSWDRISRRNSARCGLGAAEAARRSGDTDRAVTILRILERGIGRVRAPSVAPTRARDAAAARRVGAAAHRSRAPAVDGRAGRGARSRRPRSRHARDRAAPRRQRSDRRDPRPPVDAAPRRADPAGRRGRAGAPAG